MTRLLLIRHAHHDYIGRAIAGRLPGITLSERGKREAASLPDRLADAGVAAVYSSPLERALETAAPIATRLGLQVEIREALGEIGFGEWTGRTMAELEHDPLWRKFNEYRSGTRAPGGETMLETQARVAAELDRIRRAHPNAAVAVVSHGDVIRAAILHYAGIPLDLFQRIEIYPASVSVVEVDDHAPRIVTLNATQI